MKDPRQIFFRRLSSRESGVLSDIGILLLRTGAGFTMAFAHGLGKIQRLLAGGELQFPDPLGIGVGPSLFLAGMAEFFCAIAVALGLLTRLMSFPLAFTMAIAFFLVHGNDPFQQKELALIYFAIFTTLLFTGGGNLSLDVKLIRRKK